MIAWERLEQPEFDRVVEHLLVRLHRDDTPEWRPQALDGRGGDGGLDIDVWNEGGLEHVYQLKFFPEGFSGGFATSRRQQIRRSIEAVADKSPLAWTLVLPRNPTPNERDFVIDLASSILACPVAIWGRAELDILASRFPDVEAWADRTALREALEIAGRETASLTGPDDLAVEARRLSDRLAARSAHWRVDHAVIDGVVSQQLVPLTEDAAEREPIAVQLDLEPGDDRDFRGAFADAVNYGLGEPLQIPAEAIRSARIVGPEWIANDLEGDLRLLPVPGPAAGMDARMRAVHAEGRPGLTLDGLATTHSVGAVGARVTLDLVGGLRVSMTFPLDISEPGSAGLMFEPFGRSAAEAARALRFLDSLQDAEKLMLFVGEHSGSMTLASTAPLEMDHGTREFFDDLEYIEHECDIRFRLGPPTANDRLMARVVRRVLEGRCVILPRVNGIDQTMSGETVPGMRDVLQEPSAILTTIEDWEIDLLGEPVLIPQVAIYHPSLVAVDGDEALRALESGTAHGRVVHFQATLPGTPFVIYAPDRVAADFVVEAEAWTVEGVAEHPGLPGASELLEDSGTGSPEGTTPDVG